MLTKKRNLYIFIVITLASGWIGVLIDMLLTEQPEGDSLGMGIWLILPFVFSLIFHWREHDWKSMGLKLNLKGNLKWYLAALCIYPIVTLIMFILANIFNCINLSDFTFEKYISIALFTVIGSFIKNIFEEFSWRGYLTPKLLELKLNDWIIYLVSGLIWGLWHAAYYIVFLPNEYFESISRIEMIILGCCLMIAWSIMYVEIYRITKSVWPCVAMHAMEDAIPTTLVTTGNFISFTFIGDILFHPVTGILATVLLVAFGLCLRYVRVTKEKIKLGNSKYDKGATQSPLTVKRSEGL